MAIWRSSGRSALERWPISICTSARSKSVKSTNRTSSKGTPVYAGVDYETILRQAEQEADVILWDGGNNDTSFYKPPTCRSWCWIRIVPDTNLRYYPGEVNFRSADVLIINKVDTADPDGYQDSASEHRSCTIRRRR